MAPETKATPDRPGSARCPRCGNDHVETKWVNGVELLKAHNYPADSPVKCHKGSNQPVLR